MDSANVCDAALKPSSMPTVLVVPEDVLLLFFDYLAEKRLGCDTETAWATGADLTLDNYYNPRSTALLAAMQVSHAWHGPAAKLFYRNIQPRTLRACELLAETLARSPLLASFVHRLVLPSKTPIFPKQFTGRVRSLLGSRLPLRRTAQAFDAILRACFKLEHVCVYSVTPSTLAEHHGLHALAPRTVSLDFASLTTSPSESTIPLRIFQRRSAGQGLRLDDATGRLVFSRLEVLHLRLWDEICGCTPTLRHTFPVLRALFLSCTYMTEDDFVGLLCAVRGTLRVLSLTLLDVESATEKDALQVLDEQAPALALNLRDLRVTHADDATRVCTVQYLPRLESLRRLSLDSTSLPRFPTLPPRVETLVVHEDAEEIRRMLTTVGELKRRVEASPGLRRILLRSWCGPSAVADWKIACALLQPFCEARGVALQTELRIVFPRDL